MNEWAVAGQGNRIVFFFTSQETRTRLENREANRPGEREGRAKKQKGRSVGEQGKYLMATEKRGK